MNIEPQALKESTVFSGKIGEVVHTQQSDGRIFERFRRAPGTRLVIVSSENKILIAKELRQETGNYDLRLPGGKVCDILGDYHALLASGTDTVEAARTAAAKEGREEVGLDLQNLELLTKANAGATVEWDLYYFLTRNYTELPEGQQLEHGEDIEVTWMTPDEIREAITKGRMQEWRSVDVLLGLVLPTLEA